MVLLYSEVINFIF